MIEKNPPGKGFPPESMEFGVSPETLGKGKGGIKGGRTQETGKQ